eukprot:3596469-Amphidinium_carterae.1
MKVYHFWRLVGPQLRERPEEQPRVKLPAEPNHQSLPLLLQSGCQIDTDVPFQLGEHQRVVKHASFLQCLDCNRQAGKVKATGKYNFAYMRTQDCTPLKTKKHRKKPTGFTADTEETSSSGEPPVGEATGCVFPLASTVQSGNRLTIADESGNRLAAPVESGGTGSSEAAPSGLTGGAGRVLFRARPTEGIASMPWTKNVISIVRTVETKYSKSRAIVSLRQAARAWTLGGLQPRSAVLHIVICTAA